MTYKNELCNLFIDNKIDVFVGIDSPDFNMQIQKKLKRNSNIKTVQLVTPSIWAWRKGRLRNIKKFTDLSASLFKFEHDFYKKYDLKNIFLGHHFADLKQEKKSDVLKKFNLEIFKIENLSTHGGSNRYYIKKKNYLRKIEKSVKINERKELNFGLNRIDNYFKFQKRLSRFSFI